MPFAFLLFSKHYSFITSVQTFWKERFVYVSISCEWRQWIVQCYHTNSTITTLLRTSNESLSCIITYNHKFCPWLPKETKRRQMLCIECSNTSRKRCVMKTKTHMLTSYQQTWLLFPQQDQYQTLQKWYKSFLRVSCI